MDTKKFRVDQHTKLDLSDHSPDRPTDADKAAAAAETAELLTRLTSLQEILVAQDQHRVLVVLQATDTGGKDGTIRRVFSSMNPQGVSVASFKAPTEIELAHDYLWRAHARVPANGELVIFNRSHYEDVLIVRVRDLLPKARWSKRYDHIRDFEKMLVDEGTTIVKFFLHISKDEQKARLQARLDDPTKHWKFNPADLAERERWDEHQLALADAIAQTARPHAPWYVVPSNSKWYRDRIIAQVMVETLESLNMAYPLDPPGLADIVIP